MSAVTEPQASFFLGAKSNEADGVSDTSSRVASLDR